MRMVRLLLQALAEGALAPLLILLAVAARFCRKRIAVGLGPEPLINYVYHKRALALAGYSAETYVQQTYFITDEFDVRGDRWFGGSTWRLARALQALRLWFFALRRYRCVYNSFWGSPLSPTRFLWWLDPLLYRLAGVKVVILPYGSDVQDLSRCPNQLYKHAVSQDYPRYRDLRRRVAWQTERWTRHADHIVGGCDWVDYLTHWDSLTLGHFSLDTEQWQPSGRVDRQGNRTVRILHAPNHRAIKGTDHFVQAVEQLRREGLDVELVVVQRLPNDEIRRQIEEADIVADQLVIGWYAMMAIEAMSMGKPVLCYLRPDLLEFYRRAGLLAADEMPIVNCNPRDVADAMRTLVLDAPLRRRIGAQSREFVERQHGLATVAARFAAINRSLGIDPDMRTDRPNLSAPEAAPPAAGASLGDPAPDHSLAAS